MRQSDWYHKECCISKRNVRKLLKKFRRSLSTFDRDCLCKARRKYTNLLKRKRTLFSEALLHELVTSINNQKEFWNSVRKISPKRKQPVHNISVDRWFEHFKALLGKYTDTR